MSFFITDRTQSDVLTSKTCSWKNKLVLCMYSLCYDCQIRVIYCILYCNTLIMCSRACGHCILCGARAQLRGFSYIMRLQLFVRGICSPARKGWGFCCRYFSLRAAASLSKVSLYVHYTHGHYVHPSTAYYGMNSSVHAILQRAWGPTLVAYMATFRLLQHSTNIADALLAGRC